MNTHRSAALLVSLLSTACLAKGGFQAGGNAGGGGGAAGDPSGGPAEGSYGGPAEPGGPGEGGGTAPTGPAEPRWDDFAFAVRERSGTYYGPWTITKLTTFKVGQACYAKLGEKDSGSLRNTVYYIGSVHELAKKWTGEEWDRIENQRSDRAKDRALVEPMMDEFGKRFHMTIAIEGDDCETERDALWIRYWYQIGEAFQNHPPAAGKLFVTLNVSATARDITSTVDETGTKFTFTAPRDIEAKDWTDKLAKPFRKNAAKL
ncbi:MAG: hypothetical protein WKG01_37025 [Kofleriaceae bacterium]